MSELALKPCPLDGGKAALGIRQLDERNGYALVATVTCASCGCSLSLAGKADKAGWANEGAEDLKSRLAQDWNRRVSPLSDGDGRIEALEAELLTPPTVNSGEMT